LHDYYFLKLNPFPVLQAKANGNNIGLWLWQKIKKRRIKMAVFKCEKCGATKEGRCKPKKCPECAEAGTMQKQEGKKSSGCGCACKK